MRTLFRNLSTIVSTIERLLAMLSTYQLHSFFLTSNLFTSHISFNLKYSCILFLFQSLTLIYLFNKFEGRMFQDIFLNYQVE